MGNIRYLWDICGKGYIILPNIFNRFQTPVSYLLIYKYPVDASEYLQKIFQYSIISFRSFSTLEALVRLNPLYSHLYHTDGRICRVWSFYLGLLLNLHFLQWVCQIILSLQYVSWWCNQCLKNEFLVHIRFNYYAWLIILFKSLLLLICSLPQFPWPLEWYIISHTMGWKLIWEWVKSTRGRIAELYNPDMFQEHEEVIVFTRGDLIGFISPCRNR